MRKILFMNIFMFLIASNVFAQYSNNNQLSNKGQKNNSYSCEDDPDLFLKDKRVIFTNFEFLYWTADSGCTEYAYKFKTTDAELNGKYLFSGYGWDPGFRVAIGYFNAPKTYQVYGQFTWMRINNSHTINKSDNFFIAAVFNHNGQSLINEAQSKIRLNFELGDLLVSRVWIPNMHFRLRLFGGLTGGEIGQKWDIKYIDLASAFENIYNKWNFLGIGLRLGSDFDWFWSNNFYLTAKVSLAPFIGKYKYLYRISQSVGYNKVETTSDQYRGAYNFQAYLGPSYQKRCRCVRYEIFLGYELNGWINVQEKLINISPNAYEIDPMISNGMILLNGLCARLTLDF